MNRNLLYSLGLTLAAWPPLFTVPPVLEPEQPRPAIEAAAMGSSQGLLQPDCDAPDDEPAEAYKP